MNDAPDTPDSQATMKMAELRANGLRLAIDCPHCNRFRYISDRRFPDDVTLTRLAKKLTCARCQNPEVHVLAISKDEKTGFWPAERS
ncbi:MAG: hypothetical protein HWE23_02120 [Rhodobacteraceae bacterium]|nr:hypothetical protein [Paracoccaceae bacterium]